MVLFCEKCIVDIMGLTKEENPEWLIEFDGDICEGCGYGYLDAKQKLEEVK